jgi:phosphoribosyl 1,2-cyclic phosphodiesterase
MTKVCVLASGSKGNAIYVANDDTAILVDAGLPGIEIERRFASRDIHPEALDAIVVSHEHRDHVHGVGVLSRRFGIPVCINEPTWKAASPLLGSLYETRTFHRGIPFGVGSLTIHPFSVSHDAIDPVAFTIQDVSEKMILKCSKRVPTRGRSNSASKAAWGTFQTKHRGIFWVRSQTAGWSM